MGQGQERPARDRAREAWWGLAATVLGLGVGSRWPASGVVCAAAFVAWGCTARRIARSAGAGIVALGLAAVLRGALVPAAAEDPPGNFGAPRVWRPVPIQTGLRHPVPDWRVAPLQAIDESVHHHLQGPSAAIASTMILNRGESLGDEDLDAFRATGTLHLLAISGLHLTLVLELLGAAAGALGATPGSGRAVAIAVIWIYAAAVGAPASAVRAASGATLAWISRLRQVPMSALEILARSSAIVLWVSPRLASDLGFQLSVVATAGLCLVPALWPAARETGKGGGPWRALRRWVAVPVATTLVVSVVAYTVLAQAVGRVPMAGSWANVVAVPLSEVCLVGAIAGTALDRVAPAAAGAIWMTTGAALAALRGVVRLAARAPAASLRVSPPGAVWTLAFVLALAAACSDARRWRGRAALALLVAASVARPVLWPAVPPPRAGARLTVLDVGQGDGLLLEAPGTRPWVIDAGDARGRRDQGDRTMAPSLLAHGVWGPASLLITHPHADHVGGVARLEREGRVREVVTAPVSSREEHWVAARREAVARRIPWRTVTAPACLVRTPCVRVDVISPSASRLAGDADTTSTGCNERSAVARVVSQGVVFLLTGDAGARSESLWIAAGVTLRCDVLKVGHHGSRWATSDAFLDAARPRLAIVSVGARNRFGHPSPEVLERLARRGIPVLRTDREGEIECEARHGDVWWRTARAPRWRRLVPAGP